MAKLQVNTTPQPIYPDGLQHDFLLTNEGPFTVYVDDNTSVSADQSQPIPPLSSIAWKANVPLFLVGDGTSRVMIVTGDNPPLTPGDGRQEIIARDITGTFDFSDVFEVGAYQSIILTWDYQGAASSYEIDLQWYRDIPDTGTEPDVQVYQETITLDNDGSSSTAFRYIAVRNVRGRYLKVTPDPDCKLAILSGSTIAISEFTSSRASQPSRIFSTAVESAVLYGEQFAGFTLTTGDIAGDVTTLPQLGRRLRVNISFSGATTLAANLFLETQSTNSYNLYRATIAVGAVTHSFEITVPIGIAYGLRFAQDPGVNAAIACTWSDE